MLLNGYVRPYFRKLIITTVLFHHLFHTKLELLSGSSGALLLVAKVCLTGDNGDEVIHYITLSIG